MYPVLSNNLLRSQRNLMDTLFGEDFFSTPTSAVIDDYSVRTNVSTTDEEYRIDIVAPGLDKSDMNVKVENSQLYVSYDNENTDKSERVYYRSFTRYWKLPVESTRHPSVLITTRAFCPSSFPAKPLRPTPLILTLSKLHN